MTADQEEQDHIRNKKADITSTPAGRRSPDGLYRLQYLRLNV
jgi:hypothetical protein